MTVDRPPFLILSLPRSRSKWLSEFLSYRDWRCGHDEAMYFRSLDDMRSWFKQPCTGSAETGVAPFWRILKAARTDVTLVTVRRPISEVLDSLARAGMPDTGGVLTTMLRHHDRKLDQIERRFPDVLSVRFADLTREKTCATIFERCLPCKHDRGWWAGWENIQISGDLTAQKRYAAAYLPQIVKLMGAAKQASLWQVQMQRPAPVGFVIQEEHDFDTVYRDCEAVFREHLVETNQESGDFAKKNLKLLRTLAQAGAVSMITARSNGKVFGYLMVLVGPSLDGDYLEAHHLSTFAASNCPGLGRHLQAWSIENLKKRPEVREVIGRSGVRGDGPRLDALYKRLGFEDCGRLRHLTIGEIG